MFVIKTETIRSVGGTAFSGFEIDKYMITITGSWRGDSSGTDLASLNDDI